MAKLSIVAGATSQTVNVFIQDSSSTTGAGLTGLAYNTSGLTAYYAFPRAASAAITLATLAAATSAYSSGGFKEIDATNMPGVYRFDIPNAALASGNGRFVTILLKGATNMAPCVLEIELTGVDNQDATRGGMTALPNANAAATGGLPTVDANNAVKVQSGTGANQISLSSGTVTVGTNNDKTGYTVSTNNDKTGYSLAALDANALESVTAQAGAAGSITLRSAASAADDLYRGQEIEIYSGTGAGQARVITGYTGSTKVATVDENWITNPDNTSLYRVRHRTPKMDSSQQVTAASVQGNVTGSVASVTAGVTVSTNNDKTGYSLTQSFPANFASLAITAGGAVTVGTNNDKTGYSLSQTFPTNFAALAITAGGAVTTGTNNDKTGYSL